jgi:putative inorganic carbon (HCO3(-)) transporter
MVRALVMLLLGTNALVAVARPWVGVVFAYLIAILTPQTIWWWAFDGIRPSLFVVAPTLLGFAVALVAGRLDYSRVRTRLNACMLILWISFTVAYLFGPYVNVMSDWRFYDPAAQFSMLTKAFVTYFVAVILLDNTDKLKYAAMVIVITAIYMTYWANAQYFVYNHFGRLNGPTSLFGESIYFDENVFAVLFVVGMPFLYYFGRYLQNRILRWAVWLVIPLSWHAVFLTASRGALLAIGAVLMVFVMRLEKKIYGVLIVIGFMVAFAWQAGDVMKSRSATITTFEQEHSATSRLDAWDAAVKMMATHPITGVGAQHVLPGRRGVGRHRRLHVPVPDVFHAQPLAQDGQAIARSRHGRGQAALLPERCQHAGAGRHLRLLDVPFAGPLRAVLLPAAARQRRAGRRGETARRQHRRGAGREGQGATPHRPAGAWPCASACQRTAAWQARPAQHASSPSMKAMNR